MTIRRHALFDFGGPLLLTPFELNAHAERVWGLETGSLPKGPFEPDTDPRWIAWQAGEITEREYWSERAELMDLDSFSYMRAFFEPSGDHLIRTETAALVREVQAAGFRAGVLTNDLSAFHSAEWCEKITVLGQIDALIDLSATGHLKPHPLAYAAASEALGADPSAIVFLDDQAQNVAGAQAAGMTAVWFDATNVGASLDRFRTALAGSPLQ
jgi:putative hydrolase of the HAD superfamily